MEVQESLVLIFEIIDTSYNLWTKVCFFHCISFPATVPNTFTQFQSCIQNPTCTSHVLCTSKMLHFRCLSGFWILLWDSKTNKMKNSLQNRMSSVSINSEILMASISYILSTKRFDGNLMWQLCDIYCFPFLFKLKLVSAIFYQNFFFLPNVSSLKTMKNVFNFI